MGNFVSNKISPLKRKKILLIADECNRKDERQNGRQKLSLLKSNKNSIFSL